MISTTSMRVWQQRIWEYDNNKYESMTTTSMRVSQYSYQPSFLLAALLMTMTMTIMTMIMSTKLVVVFLQLQRSNWIRINEHDIDNGDNRRDNFIKTKMTIMTNKSWLWQLWLWQWKSWQLWSWQLWFWQLWWWQLWQINHDHDNNDDDDLTPPAPPQWCSLDHTLPEQPGNHLSHSKMFVSQT